MPNWIKVAVIGIAAFVAAALFLQRRAPPPAASGDPTPPLVLPDLAGRTVDLAALKGKVVAVNFWATWCGPCRLEMPELVRVWKEQHGRCFEVLGVAEESARADVQRVAPEIPYPILLDERASALGPWKVPGYPRTYVVDPEGRIREVFEGALSGGELEDAIRPLLPASCPAS